MKNLSMYIERWVALAENNDVAGIGLTPQEAQRRARRSRPKDRLRLVWVSPHPPHIPLPEWPLVQLRPFLPPGKVWLAGGPVRDLLLGRPLHDWDFAVAGEARQLARQVANALGAAYYTLDDERDAGRVVAQTPVSEQMITLDFTRLRGDTVEEDLRQRDFTINAMALTLDGQLIDPTGGQQDLQAGQIRQANAQSLYDDPARLLRAVRQAGELGFEIEAQTERAIRAQAAHIKETSPERARDELLKMMRLPNPSASLEQLKTLGLLVQLMPEVAALGEIKQTWPHYYEGVWEHTLAAIASTVCICVMLKGKPVERALATRVAAPSWAWGTLERVLIPLQVPLLAYLDEPLSSDICREELLKWGALLHDIGKAETRTVGEKGLTHFYGHADAGAATVEARLAALRFPGKATACVTTLVREHMRLIGLGKKRPSRRAVYRFYRSTQDAGVGVVLLALADALAVWGRNLEAPRWQRLLDTAEVLLTHYFHRKEEVIAPPPLLTGYDLLAMGIPQGPGIGRLLEALREAQATGRITDAEAARTFVQQQAGIASSLSKSEDKV